MSASVFRGYPFLSQRANGFAPFAIGRKAIALKRRNGTFAAFLPRQPRAELVGIFPTDTHYRLILGLRKTGRLPTQVSAREALLLHCRVHSTLGIVVSRLRKGLKIG